VWQRIEPLLIPEIIRARDIRLRLAGDQPYLERRDLVVDQLAKFMATLPPLHLALLPPFMEFLCGNWALAQAVALDDDPNHVTLNEQTREAISRLAPELETQKLERAAILRSLLPQEDTYEGATDEQVVALATSVYECPACHLTTSGLRMLAHHCCKPREYQTQQVQFSEEGRRTVETLLRLMGLGKETTELEMDNRKDRFLCVGFPRALTHSPRYYARDWRSCVRLNPYDERVIAAEVQCPAGWLCMYEGTRRAHMVRSRRNGHDKFAMEWGPAFFIFLQALPSAR
jgi:hypothetical protein